MSYKTEAERKFEFEEGWRKSFNWDKQNRYSNHPESIIFWLESELINEKWEHKKTRDYKERWCKEERKDWKARWELREEKEKQELLSQLYSLAFPTTL